MGKKLWDFYDRIQKNAKKVWRKVLDVIFLSNKIGSSSQTRGGAEKCWVVKKPFLGKQGVRRRSEGK